MSNERRPRRRRHRVFSFALAVAVLAAPGVTAAQDPGQGGEVAFSPVLATVLEGDLVMAGNSNLLAAGGWRVNGAAAADVDADSTLLCVGRRYVPAACADNSSSATVDIPPGARVVQARLYVNSTLTVAVSPLRVRLDGPSAGYDYTELGPATPGIAKIYEGSGGGRAQPIMRQAVWDVTSYVAAAGPGAYTVADIMYERSGAWLPYASWAIVVAYERDPDSQVVVAELPVEQQQRFARRAISWHDGFVVRSEGSIDVPVTGLETVAGQPTFAKSFHIVAHAQARGADNLLLDGDPIGNNLMPGASPAPPGVAIGADPACNSITDVLNDSICVLGSPVETKVPGPREYRASRDGVTPTSGSAVDMDVIRIPDRYFRAAATSATLSLRAIGAPVAPGMLAVSVDLPAADPTLSAAGDLAGAAP
jgi:hypothetical protein